MVARVWFSFSIFHPFLGLDRLVQAVGPAAARHEAAGELVDDQHLAVLHHVIHVPLEQGVGAQRLLHVVQDLHVAGIVEVVDLEQLLHLEYPFFGEGGGFGLFVDGEVAGVVLPFSRTGCSPRPLSPPPS